MSGHPVRLIVSDDLRRGRGSVLLRLWFAIPFLLWLALWALVAFLVAIANWVATLVVGRPPAPLHGFLARFVRFATHAYAYLLLAAEPLPGFGGAPGYPVDVEIDPPAPQRRWTVAVRLVLAVPAILLAGVLLGSADLVFTGAGLAFTAAFLGWFAALARARMPRGLRDLVAYGLSYSAQLWAYLLLLTDRYPYSDPLSAIDRPPTVDHPLRLESSDDLRRSRLTVFFRLLLAIPHLVWLSLWAIAALLAAIANWFATLLVGTSPEPLHRFLAAYVRYQLNVTAYLYLIGNPFPGFTGREGSYPVEIRIAGAQRQNRWTVGLRLLLVVPALLLAGAYGTLVLFVAFLGWSVALLTGRMPAGLRNAGALALRYLAQVSAYLFLVTGAYPYSGPCLAPAPQPEAPPSPPRAAPW